MILDDDDDEAGDDDDEDDDEDDYLERLFDDILGGESLNLLRLIVRCHNIKMLLQKMTMMMMMMSVHQRVSSSQSFNRQRKRHLVPPTTPLVIRRQRSTMKLALMLKVSRTVLICHQATQTWKIQLMMLPRVEPFSQFRQYSNKLPTTMVSYSCK